MTLKPEQFIEIKTYLLYDKKLSQNGNNDAYKSHFFIMQRFFADKDFNRQNFNKFIAYLREKGYSNNYINNFIKLAKHIDKFYKINELQDYTYFDKTTKPVDSLSPEQIESMINIHIPYDRDSQLKNQMYQAVILTLFLTGARISEVLDLTWQDLKSGAIPFLIINQKKIHELRYAPIPERLYNTLVSLPHFSGFIFSSRSGHQITRQTISSDIKKRAEAVGITQRVWNHLMRHSFVNFMLKSGAPLEQVSRLVGHKSIETTNKYYVSILLDQLANTLHVHHPYFKKEQTLEKAHKMIDNMISKFLHGTRFSLKKLELEEND